MSEPFQLINEVDTTGFGDVGARLGDLDGDGEQEIVFFQARDCHIRRMSAGGYEHEKQVHCISAMKLDGDVMWQEGAPLGTGFWPQHGLGAEVADIDSDGRSEIIYLTERGGRNWLRILEGDRGYFRNEVETGPNCVLQLCNIRGLESKRDILVSTFVNPIYIYADDLTCLWNCHFYGGAGHSHAFSDIDGDGKDELFIGYCCVRADGLKIWWRPDLEPCLEEMGRSPHVDDLQVHDIDGDGRLELVMVAGKDLVVLDAETGEDRFIFEGIHIQSCAVGNFILQKEGLELYTCEKRRIVKNRSVGHRAYLVDCYGNEIWRRDKSGYGQPIQLADREEQCIIVQPGGKRPLILDGQGNIVQEISMPAYTHKPDRFDVNATSDFGETAGYRLADINGDGKIEIIFFNRTRLWHWAQS